MIDGSEYSFFSYEEAGKKTKYKTKPGKTGNQGKAQSRRGRHRPPAYALSRILRLGRGREDLKPTTYLSNFQPIVYLIQTPCKPQRETFQTNNPNAMQDKPAEQL